MAKETASDEAGMQQRPTAAELAFLAGPALNPLLQIVARLHRSLSGKSPVEVHRTLLKLFQTYPGNQTLLDSFLD